MIVVRHGPILALIAAAAMAVSLADCAGFGSGRSREERESRANVYPDNYKADLLAALHTYVADPTNIRDAYLSDPAIRTIGTQNRYSVCVRFNAKNSDGRYAGSRDAMAIFVAGRFDQFVDPSAAASQPNVATLVKEQCGQAEFKRFPELEALTR
jgi:hypothetical protein